LSLKKKHVISALFFAIIVCLVLVFFMMETFQRNKAIFYYKKGEYLKSVQRLESLVLTRPHDFKTHFFLSESLRSLRRYPEARKVLENFFNNNPDNGNARMSLAFSRFERGDLEEIASLINDRKFLSSLSKSDRILAEALIHLNKSSFADSIRCLEKVQFEDKRHRAVSEGIRGLSLYSLGYFRQARQALDKSRENFSDNPVILAFSSVLHFMDNNIHDALYTYDYCASLDSGENQNYVIEQLIDNFTFSRGDSFPNTVYEALNSSNQNLYMALWASFLAAEGESPDPGLKFLEKMSAETSPSSVIPDTLLGIHYLNGGIPDKAAQYFSRAGEKGDILQAKYHLENIYRNRLPDIMNSNYTEIQIKTIDSDKKKNMGDDQDMPYILLFRNSAVKFELTCEGRGEYTVIIESRGTSSGLIWPRAALFINGIKWGHLYFRHSYWDILPVKAQMRDGVNLIELKYINDEELLAEGEDRNLCLRRIFISRKDGK
jgi:tetratricopeptide (TPR) repeat protein